MAAALCGPLTLPGECPLLGSSRLRSASARLHTMRWLWVHGQNGMHAAQLCFPVHASTPVQHLPTALPMQQPTMHPQIRRKVLDGGRPEVPPLTELPGPDNHTFAPFEAYCQLMRWDAAACRRAGCLWAAALGFA